MRKPATLADAAARPAPRTQAAATDARRAGLLGALGRTVRALRAGGGLSQQALAARAGLSPRFVSQLEAGEGNISVGKLAEVARALGVPLAALLAPEAAAGDRNGAAAAGDAEALRAYIAAALEGRSAGELRAMLAALDGTRPATLPGVPAAAEAAQPALIALVGLRGAGKSTVGPLLARALGRPFVELDDRIQEQSGLAVEEIFALHGEGYYRELERAALERLLAHGPSAVVAVSGGSVTDPALFRLLRERTLLVWVRARPEQHMERVASQGDQRPMADRADAMAELRNLLRARTPSYEQAQLVVDTSADTPQACVRRLVAGLRRLGV
jgi:XRE family transcriptional regulator, aerobic/anaerobic benzoate catabolism transcriptional regulator